MALGCCDVDFLMAHSAEGKPRVCALSVRLLLLFLEKCSSVSEQSGGNVFTLESFFEYYSTETKRCAMTSGINIRWMIPPFFF